VQEYLKSKYPLDNPLVVSALDDLPLWSAPFGLKLLDVVKLKRNMNVLDIGSGTGFPLIEMSQRVDNSCRVIGIDPWKEAIDRTDLKIKTWHIANAFIIQGVAEEMPFKSNFFDLIISNNGINNVENEAFVYQEIKRISKPACQMVLTMNLPDSMKEFYNIFKDILYKFNKKREIEKLKNHIFHKRKPIDHSKTLIKKAGFHVTNISQSIFQLKFLDGTTMFNHSLIQVGFINNWKQVLHERDLQSIFGMIEKDLNKIAHQKGELCLTIPWICINCQKSQ
jgi:arsenite methyltransferase